MPAALLMSLDMLYEVSAALQFVRPGFNPAGLMLHRQAKIQKATVRSNAILNIGIATTDARSFLVKITINSEARAMRRKEKEEIRQMRSCYRPQCGL